MTIHGGNRVFNKYNISQSLWKGVAVPCCLLITNNTLQVRGHCTGGKVQNRVDRGLGAPSSTVVEAIRRIWGGFI